MTQPDSESVIWKIKNFAKLSSAKSSPHFKVKQSEFWLGLYPKDDLKYMPNHVTIHLLRAPPRTTDVKVQWTISLINDKGQECYSKVLEANYIAQTQINSLPNDGTLYHLNRDTILHPSSGLLPGGKLIVKYTVTILDGQNNVNLDDTKVTLVHKKTLENYQSLLESSKLSDVVFVIGQKQFKLHKIILSAQSPVFAAMFDSDLEEVRQSRVDIIDVDVDVFEAMIRFIYSGNVDSVDQHALELFVAADKYQLDSLKDMCAQSLGSSLTIESVANILLVADMHSDQELKTKCVKYINQNALKVMVTEGWKQLAKNEKPFELLHELYHDIITKANQ